jgi:transcriptional regulator with XRE-family HTH domain
MTERINNLKAERARYGWTCEEVAKMLGVHENTVQNWEKDIGTCKGTTLLSLSNIFGVSVDYLLGISDERKIK